MTATPTRIALACSFFFAAASSGSGQEENEDFWGEREGAFDVRVVMSAMARGSLAPGDPAPGVTLLDPGGGERIELSRLWKGNPLVLFFGSATCSFNIELSGEVRTVFERYRRSASFAWVYLREAHGYELDPSTDRSNSGRIEAARRFRQDLGLPFPVYVDPVGDRAARDYAAWPTRIVVILPGGEIGFSSAVGHWGFRPLETTASFEPDSTASFAPPGHLRPSLESYLKRLFLPGKTRTDSFSGKSVLTGGMARSLVFSRLENAPLAGEPAISLDLFDPGTNRMRALREFWQEKPVVLTMGSLSAAELSESMDDLLGLHRDFGSSHQFVHVYLRESEGLRVGGDPGSLEERAAMARRWKKIYDVPWPVLVDPMSDPAAVAYSAWPSRLVVIGKGGRILYRGYQAPWGFSVEESGRFSPPLSRDPRIAGPGDLQSLRKFLSSDSERAP